ncbi:flagellin, partial [Hydrogenophaga palleronii]|uniref:flagellin n=1 Tax=Hydrogenophaga palleronii TaxID=65655 RepID=UPI0024809D20
FANATFQVGANAGEGIAIDSIVSANSTTLGNTSQITSAGTLSTTTGAHTAIAAGALNIKGTLLGPIAGAASASERALQVVDAINAKSSETGIFARATVDAAGAVTSWEAFSDGAIAVADFGNFGAATTGVFAVGAAASSQLDDINVNSFGDAQKALKVIDSAINSINSSRADLGALQSRFENAVANIQITGENISAA